MKKIILLLFIAVSVHAQVTQSWVKRYNGSSSNSHDEPRKILVNKTNGDVYVTGKSPNSNLGLDIITIKYNQAGVQQWLRSYKGISGSKPFDMVFDNLGGIIITGIGPGNNFDDDCVTLKYDYNGTLQWVKRYNGTGNGHDRCLAITADLQGGVIVTGVSPRSFSGTNTYDDIITIKYDYYGNQEWVQRYNGPGNSLDGGNSVITDDNNDVYVTGYISSPNTGYDIVTIKYAMEGNIEWVKTIPSAGTGSGSKILYSRKYSEIYTIGQNGSTTDIFCYDYSGNLKWQSSDFGAITSMSGAVLDEKNSMIYLTGVTRQNQTNDYMIIGYNTYVNGGLSWFDIYDGYASGNDYPKAITVDGYGNIILTGASSRNGPFDLTSLDYTTVKYNLSGMRLWEKRYNNSGTGTHIPVSIATDNSGNIFVTGYSHNSSGNFDFATIKYTEDIVLGKDEINVPSEFDLHQNYPNPFNPSTVIKFDIPTDEFVRIAVYDMLGKEIAVPVNEFKHAGSYEVNIDGSALASGTYFYRINAGNFTEIKKMILIK